MIPTYTIMKFSPWQPKAFCTSDRRVLRDYGTLYRALFQSLGTSQVAGTHRLPAFISAASAVAPGDSLSQSTSDLLDVTPQDISVAAFESELFSTCVRAAFLQADPLNCTSRWSGMIFGKQSMEHVVKIKQDSLRFCNPQEELEIQRLRLAFQCWCDVIVP